MGECVPNANLSVPNLFSSSPSVSAPLITVDLRGNARINIRSKQSGFRQLRIILKLVDGGWIVSDQYVPFREDWAETEFRIADIRWRELNIETVTEAAWVENPNLSKVSEVGFTDLMAGGGTPASSRLDWIEVYGKAVTVKSDP